MMRMAYELHPMTLMDLDGVMEVEHLSFPTPWPRRAFEQELTENRFARYYVAREGDRVAGYAGCWIVLDEAHVTNVAVHPHDRGQHLGKALMLRLMQEAAAADAPRMTLEVRVTNEVAQNLYRTLGFEAKGRRKAYYSDTGEDALLMWQEDIPKYLAQTAEEETP